MPQITLRHLHRKVDRKRLLLAGVIAGLGLSSWLLFRDKPPRVEEPDWDSIVFPEMAGSPMREREPLPLPPELPAEIAPNRSNSGSMQIEVAANAALWLDEEWRPAPQSIPRHPGISLATEPTRLEGGIEPIDAPAR